MSKFKCYLSLVLSIGLLIFASSVSARFYSVDPVSAQQHVESGNLQGFNRYAYANNNPYKYVDPDGEIPIIPIAIFIAKELAGEAFEQATGIPAPTIKNAGKAIGKNLAKKAVTNKVTDPSRLLPSPSKAGPHYPSNDGFTEKAPFTLLPGTKIDRYGSPKGRFVADEGTPFGQRSLPQYQMDAPYNSYKVKKPLTVEAGPAAPWFGQQGGGIQYKLPSSVNRLLDDGVLKK